MSQWSPFISYQPGVFVSYQGSTFQALALQPNSNRVPPSSPLYWTQTSSPGGGVISIGAGTAISVGGTSTVPVVSNTGVTAVGVGTGLSTSAATGSLTLANTGVLGLSSILNGGVSVGGTAQNPILTGTYYAGRGITVAPDLDHNVAISNTGVLSVAVGSGLSTSGASGAITLANTGVTSIVAGTNVTLSGGVGTGAVTVNASGGTSGTVTSVTSAGVGSGIVVGGTATDPTISTALTAGDGVVLSNGTGNALVITAGIDNNIIPYSTIGNAGWSYGNGGTSSGQLISGYCSFIDSLSNTWTKFSLPPGVWLCQMLCECDTNSSTAVGTQGVFSLQQVAVGSNINTCAVSAINSGGLTTAKNSSICYFSSSSTQSYQLYFLTAGGQWFSNGSARCLMSFCKIAGAFGAGPDCRPFS